MNGWLRLSIVLSFVWEIAVFLYVRHADIQGADDWFSLSYGLCSETKAAAAMSIKKIRKERWRLLSLDVNAPAPRPPPRALVLCLKPPDRALNRSFVAEDLTLIVSGFPYMAHSRIFQDQLFHLRAHTFLAVYAQTLPSKHESSRERG